MSVKVQRELAMKVKQIRSVFSQGIMHNFHSSTSEKRKRKSGEIRGKFPLSHAGEREKISHEKRQNLSGAIKKKSLSFHPLCPLFAPAFPPLFTLFTPHGKTGLQEQIMASQPLFFPAWYLFPSASSGAVHGLRRRKKIAS